MYHPASFPRQNIDPTDIRMRDSELFAATAFLVCCACIVLLCVGLS